MKKQDISPSAITAGYLKRQRRYILTTGILLLLTLSLAAVMMLYGNTIYSPETVLRVLSGTDAGGAAFTIRTLRFPRMLTAILCGMAFGLSGNTFQQLLGNPLASPDIIGVTSGASVAAVFGILILQLGEAHAVTLGIPVSITRLLLILLALVLTAFAASVTGPIASVAFLSGPIAARISGRGRSSMLAASLTGSILILISDLVGQFTLPSRYPVGVITGILGAPYLLFLLLRINHKGD